ncbi:beta-ketoacyl synthase N-terminal-like domain-containing protein [Kitasatospora purpeofusca]|uniref:beta-ketoacyl synthase N-terminal-like domain-containing protein n=1 Tax=Kitasatospora purpeofusca TaxID=67352 RepID=UPI002A5A4AC4|nr:beta-ketoacyl synthase N-terminal-like domain-containing protein [Kitasatospora purpeofusca]MDY0812026.1 beta-ketoacyl synthase N-terminal-like domain-containing protein [Kitasatospora purpeofusca]
MPRESRAANPVEPGQPLPLPSVRSYVREVVAAVVGGAAADLTGPDALRELDMDSLTRLNITLRFDQDLGDIPTTLMFEHQTVDDLARYLLAERADGLRRVLPPPPGPSRTPDRPRPEPAVAVDTPATGSARSTGSAGSADDIAVIAVTGRYPGAPDLETLWRNLRDGVSSIGEVPADRWDWREFADPPPGQPGPSRGRWGAFIDGVTEFDAEFFNILPVDAVNTDPQERLFLQTCFHLLEQAGQLGPTTHEPSTGVFVGTMNATYGRIGATAWPSGRLTGANSAPWSIANRVSYFFDLHGPSFAVDSACSSSLTAVHLAVQSLRSGECRTAIVGGVNLILHPAHLAGLSAAGMLSSDEACKVFDAAADGYVPGEGVGAALLKPLAAAVADGDRIWGVIKGTALNAAGRTSGYAVPNPARQAEVVAAALQAAGVTPGSVSYVEAHGTGTELGDPLEAAGLVRALTPDRAPQAPCAVGSIKANIGHLEGAAGIAGLTKVLLQLKHRQIAPNAQVATLNPKIVESSVLRFPRALEDWPADGPRRAGVSSFGAGGANVHLVVEEYLSVPPDPTGEPAEPAESAHLVLLSARTEPQLRHLAAALARQLADSGQPDDLAALAHSTQTGRRELPVRLAVTAADTASVRAALTAFADGDRTPSVRTGRLHPDRAPGELLDDEDGQTYVDSLLAKRRLGRLADLWVDGTPIDWPRLWAGRPPARVELPPYPFEPVHYWVQAAREPARTTDLQAAAPAAVPTARTAPSGPGGTDGRAGTEGRRALVESDLRLAACGFLLIDPADVDLSADLMELGFDSVSLVQLTGRIGDTYGVEVEPVVVFDHPTLADLGRLLLTGFADAVDARHRKLTDGTADAAPADGDEQP